MNVISSFVFLSFICNTLSRMFILGIDLVIHGIPTMLCSKSVM